MTLETRTYNYLNLFEFSSNIASFVYRLPVGQFDNIAPVLKTLPSNVYLQRMVVKNVANISDLQQIQENLTNKLIVLRAKAGLESYTLGTGTIIIKYHGDPNEFKKRMLGLENLKLGNGRFLTIPDKINPYYIDVREEAKNLIKVKEDSYGTT